MPVPFVLKEAIINPLLLATRVLLFGGMIFVVLGSFTQNSYYRLSGKINRNVELRICASYVPDAIHRLFICQTNFKDL